MNHWKKESILQDLKDGRIDEYDARRALERETGDCSCMRDHIERTVRDVSNGWRDVYSGTRDIEREEFSCRMRDKERRKA